jgi:hypothetical protein
MEKKYPIGDKDMILPADKVAFMLKTIQELKADNKIDHESGEYDRFNVKQEGRYKALEEVLQWLNPAAPTGARWVKATTRLPGWEQLVKWRFNGVEQSEKSTVKMSFNAANLDRWEWLDESGTANNIDPDELWDEYSEATDNGIVMTREGWRKMWGRIKQ